MSPTVDSIGNEQKANRDYHRIWTQT